MARGQNGVPDVVMVFVVDPVAHTFETWVQGQEGAAKTALVVKLPAGQQQQRRQQFPPRAAKVPDRPQAIVTTEDLGTEAVEGLPVTVSKTTTILPAGTVGNDAPITRTHETWTSPDLQLVMKEQWEDPRSGEITVELEDLSRAEPDPALFHAPAGYAVKDTLQSLKDLEQKLNDAQN